MKYIYFAIICIAISGCAACPQPIPEPPIGLPERELLIPMTEEQWFSIRPDVQDVISLNDLALKETIKKLEGRIRVHDEPLR